MNKEAILKALSMVEDPDLKKDLVTLGMIENLSIEGLDVRFDLVLTTPACPMKETLVNACKTAILYTVNKEANIHINATHRVVQQTRNDNVLSGVKHVIAVASGKGGVGKSTLSASLALGLSHTGAKVGLLDADIYGPSVPTLFNVHSAPEMVEKNGKNVMIPITSHGLKLLSIGFMTAPGQAVVWRGPMISSAFKQFINDVDWGELDYLIVDLPPGTGDAILTFAQELNVDGSIIVTTPQQLSITDANRGIEMFKKTNIPILGIIENMSFIEDKDGNKMFPFGKDGSDNLSKKQGICLLEKIKIDNCFNKSVEKGIVFEELSEDIKEKFLNIGKEILN